MARTTITQITDDIDGTSNAEEVSFAFMGVEYTIDLAKKNRAALEKALKPYVDAGKRVPRRSGTGTRSRKSATRSSATTDLRAVRAWAAENGHEVSTRGRVPAAVLEAYEKAHA
ncbi:Lsr2 family protein [Nocardioides sp. MH1]|uniref:histone-like nucleoid-structuring protein Lsr2 n=1 Tax=Nocardioides sp. MH1 TaxID=3242490 RepID=UPI0035203727